MVIGGFLAGVEGNEALADGGVIGGIDDVLGVGGEDAGDFPLGYLDAGGVHGVGREDAGDGAGGFLFEGLKFFEDTDGAVGVVAGGVEVLHAEVIGLGFVLAGEVEEGGGDGEADALAGGIGAETVAEEDAERDGGETDDLGFGGPFGHVAGGDVGDFVGYGGGEFVLFVSDFDEGGVDEDVAAGEGEGVGRIALDDLKGEGHLGVGIADEVLADAADVFGNKRILDEFCLALDFLGELTTEGYLFFEGVEIDALADIAGADAGGIVLTAGRLGEYGGTGEGQEAAARAKKARGQKTHRLLRIAILNVLYKEWAQKIQKLPWRKSRCGSAMPTSFRCGKIWFT